MAARRYSLDIPDTGNMSFYPTEALLRQAYSETNLPCAAYDRDVCIAEKELVDIGLDCDGNPILILEEQEQEGDEYVCLEPDASLV